MFTKEQLTKVFEQEKKFDVESWYPSLRNHTFETDFQPLTIEEAVCIVQKYRRDVSKRQGKYHILDEEGVLLGLQAKLETKILEMKQCFIRLSTRSPKDAVLDLDESKEFMQEQFEKYISSIPNIQERLAKVNPVSEDKQDEFTQEDLLNALTNEEYNEILKTIFNSTKELLMVDNSKRAMIILTQSERVSTDLRRLLLCEDIDIMDEVENNLTPEVRKKQLCSISFRKWEQGLLDEYEFRCFYYNKTLTAISQYNYYFYEKDFASQQIQDTIKREITNKFNELKDNLPSENGVIDFAVFYRDNPIKTIMIELNPFNEYEGAGTGGSLFCWRADIEKLKNGDSIEMRVIKEYRQDVLQNQILFFSGDSQNIIAKAILAVKVSQPDKSRFNCSIY